MSPDKPTLRYRDSARDTPVKKNMANDATIQRTIADEVDEFVAHDLNGNRHLVETPGFLNDILALPAPEMVEKVLNKMQEQKLFRKSPEPRWEKFPLSDDIEEEALHDPFTEAANAIVNAASSSCRLLWKVSPQEAPVTRYEPAVKMFPDVVAVLRDDDNNETFSRLETTIRNSTAEVCYGCYFLNCLIVIELGSDE